MGSGSSEFRLRQLHFDFDNMIASLENIRRAAGSTRKDPICWCDDVPTQSFADAVRMPFNSDPLTGKCTVQPSCPRFRPRRLLARSISSNCSPFDRGKNLVYHVCQRDVHRSREDQMKHASSASMRPLPLRSASHAGLPDSAGHALTGRTGSHRRREANLPTITEQSE